ncbi:hypothetical protein E4U58_004943 [Claviceps cyperi]|nr:hypothetical protein E4U58_004943 [Claviceps cyperi]
MATVGHPKPISRFPAPTLTDKSCDDCVMCRQGHTMACFIRRQKHAMDRLLPSLAKYTSCSQAPASSNGDTMTFLLAMDCINNKFVIANSVVVVRTNSMLQA